MTRPGASPAEPQTLARQMLVELPHPTAGSVRLAGTPFKLARTQAGVHRPPPLLGEHTDELLASDLELSGEEIEELRRQGVV